MPATHQVFEHFVETGEFNVTMIEPELSPHQQRMKQLGFPVPKDRPYFTYEIGIDEPVHPDRNIAMRFVEFGFSDCAYGCKIFADPYSEVRVLVHYEVYGCWKTKDKLERPKTD